MSPSQSASPPVVVTGAAGGIGSACVAAFLDQGWPVVGLDRVPPTVPAPGHGHAVDVTDAAAVRSAANLIAETHGPVGVLVCAAGILDTGDLAEHDPDRIRAMTEVNVMGVLTCLQAFAPQLRETRGAVVTIASNAAGVPRRQLGAYGATKAAATMLTLSFGLEMASAGVRCNVVQPGSTDTAMLRGLWGEDPEEIRLGRAATIAGDPAQHRLGIPLGRIAAPKDIAGVVAALCGPEFVHVTMQEIYVDGGASLHA